MHIWPSSATAQIDEIEASAGDPRDGVMIQVALDGDGRPEKRDLDPRCLFFEMTNNDAQ